ncbi:hypothetical protein A3835_09680 [Campylobacter concisus]|uniref:Uncharacterized protein n=1 Tax=Campylobacter concisus TaxID=199 RepID=A0A1X0U493_9BACT|nr:hypothetical protein A3835_09680 [Campylobacter concisus]
MYSGITQAISKVSQVNSALKAGGVAGAIGAGANFDLKDNPVADITALGIWGLKNVYNSFFDKKESVDVDKNIKELSEYYAKQREAKAIDTQKEKEKPKEDNLPKPSDNDKPSSVPLTLLGVLDQQNHILKLMSLNLAVLGAVKNNAFDKQASAKKDNLYNQSPEIQGRVTFDRKTGYWVDPTTKTLYNPYTGDRIYDNASSNTGGNSAVSTGVDFKEVLKSQEKINSEISKYISTIGENQKVYNQNLEKLVVNSKEYSQAIKDGLAGVKLKASVAVDNNLNASLAINKPVEITLPSSYVDNQKILSDNSTKTLEIYKEKADFYKTSIAVKDLDGNTIANASPRDIALSRQAVQARVLTDENSFELDSDALNLFDIPIPNFKDLFDTELPSKTLLKDLK